MADKPVFYWDACMFFEWLCDEPVPPACQAEVERILQENKEKKNIIITSAITHIECVPQKLETKKPGALAKFESIFDGVHFSDVEVTVNVLKLAREIRDFYYVPYNPLKNPPTGKMMDTGDAIHLATAIIYEAQEFHSRDDKAKGSKVPLVGLYDYSRLNKVCGKYPMTIISPESSQGVLDVIKASN